MGGNHYGLHCWIASYSERVTRNKRIKMCRVQWSHHSEAEATWEREDELRKTYPDLFASQPAKSRGRDFFKGVGSVKP